MDTHSKFYHTKLIYVLTYENRGGSFLNSKLEILSRCLALFLIAVLLWHTYRFVVGVHPFFPYLEWGKPLGYFFYLGVYVLIFVVLILFVKVIDRSSLSEIGLLKAKRWRTYVMFGVLFAFIARFSEIFMYLIFGGTLRLGEYPSSFIILFFILDTLIVGLAEEGVFRGYIQKHLTHNYRFVPALLVSSYLFHIYHVNFFSANLYDINLIVSGIVPSFGMFAGYLYYRTGENLLGPIMLHMFYDLFGTIVPLEVGMGNLPTGARIIQWTLFMIALKILADRKIL